MIRHTCFRFTPSSAPVLVTTVLGALLGTQAAAQSSPAAGLAPRPAAAASAVARPAAPATELERVQVSGTANEAAQRRASTAAKIVVGREEIERFGDSSVSEVLKRLPGVTTGGRPGRGGDVRMRGMGGGYTQMLVNGERMPPGFSLDNLPPDQVERIEVMRAPTAEFGARAVAGTINIVLKQALKRTLNEVRLGLGAEAGRVSPNASWTRNDKLASLGTYNLTVSLNRNKRWDDADQRTRWYDRQDNRLLLDQHETGFSRDLRESVNINGRLQIPLAEGESLTLTPFAVLSEGKNFAQQQLIQAPGGITPPPYARFSSEGEGRFTLLRGNAQYQKRLDENTRWEMRGGLGQGRFESHNVRQEWHTLGTLSRHTDDRTDSRETSYSLNGKLSRQLQSEHSLVGGLELEGSVRKQSRSTLQNGLPILTEFGDDISASSRRLAAYVQDEWNPRPQISAYAGLRWEGIRTRSDSANYQASNTSSVLTPLLHGVWKPDEKSRNQWRSSLTRSYKAATLQELMGRPTLSQRFPTGANEISSPDRAGNPQLKPELATGVELAYEHYLPKGGLLSANVFYRRINNLIRNVVALEDVSWSADKRWVSRPQNVGKASTQGLELEAKFRFDELIEDALPVALRSNLSVFDSKVDPVPGPNNRLEGQPKGTANVGADYKLRGLPLSLGASVNYTPGYALRLSDVSSSTVGSKTVADAFVLWFINPQAQLRFSANNLLPHDYLNTSTLLNDKQSQVNETANNSKVNWGLRLELKL